MMNPTTGPPAPPRGATIRSALARFRRPVVQVAADALVWHAARAMARAEVGAVLVPQPERNTWGILAERDVVRQVVARGLDPTQVRVGDVMRPVAPRVHLDAELLAALRYLAQIEQRHAIVMSQGRLVSVIAMNDLVSALTAGPER